MISDIQRLSHLLKVVWSIIISIPWVKRLLCYLSLIEFLLSTKLKILCYFKRRVKMRRSNNAEFTLQALKTGSRPLRKLFIWKNASVIPGCSIKIPLPGIWLKNILQVNKAQAKHKIFPKMMKILFKTRNVMLWIRKLC